MSTRDRDRRAGRVSRPAATLVAALGAALAACGDEPLPLEPVAEAEVLLLTQSADLVWYPAIDYRGAITVDDAGCIRLDLAEPDNATIVWPSGTSVWMRGDTKVIRNDFGRELLDVGEAGRFSGGYASALDDLTDLTSRQRSDVRDRCPGLYWLVTDGTVRRER